MESLEKSNLVRLAGLSDVVGSFVMAESRVNNCQKDLRVGVKISLRQVTNVSLLCISYRTVYEGELIRPANDTVLFTN